MATVDEGAARKLPKNEDYYKGFEKIYGWQCFYCRVMTKETHCPLCKRSKEDAELRT